MKRICSVAAGLALVLAPAAIAPGTAVADPHALPAGYGQPIDYVIQRALSARGMPYVYGGGNTSGPTTGARPGTAATGTPRLPGMTQPGMTQPGMTQPGMTLPGTTLPGTTLPGTATAPVGPAAPGGALGTAPSGVFGSPGITPSATTVGFDSSGLIQYAYAAAGIKMPRTSGEQCNVGHKVPPAQARPGDLLCYGPGGTQSVAMYLGNNQMIEGTEPAVTVSPARTTNMVPYLTRIIG